jgi:DNA processing protein
MSVEYRLSDKPYWVGFNHVKGVGAVRLQGLLEHFGSAEAAWNAPADALKAAGLSERVVGNLLEIRRDLDIEKNYQQTIKRGIHILTLMDEKYPKRLREINQAPPVIYTRGEVTAEDEWGVAIVGTRRITAYGQQVTEEIASMLARHGITVISGLARGVDAAAHQAALAAGGRTIGVLGSGVDRIYPPEHRRLAERMFEKGAIVSDYAPGTGPDAANFPPRNRIISGLSRAVVVVEAGEDSGALITANFAAEQGREVFAVPGNINAPQSQGTNRLIRDGARPLLDPQELIGALDLEMVVEHRQARSVLPVDATEAALLNLLKNEPLHVDEIQAQSGLAVEKVSAALALLELKGLVRQVGGMNYVAVREARGKYEVGEQE